MSDMTFLPTVMCTIRAGILLAVASVICVPPSAAQAQYIQDDYLRRQMQALGAIKETANAICYTVKQEGQTFQGTLSGDVKAKLENAISTVKDLKVDGSGQVRAVEYHGVVQEALASTLHDSQSCKRSVFDRLVVIMVPSVQDTGLPITKSVHLNPRRPENKPSISCSNITEPLEQLLCADDDLAKWDGRMGQLYWGQMRQLSAVGQQRLKQQQLNWIGRRNIACKYNPLESYSLAELAPAKPCILQMTMQRAKELDY
jgi:uncharacterized protein YecT (DUF1311 family)